MSTAKFSIKIGEGKQTKEYQIIPNDSFTADNGTIYYFISMKRIQSFAKQGEQTRVKYQNLTIPLDQYGAWAKWMRGVLDQIDEAGGPWYCTGNESKVDDEVPF